MEDRTCSTSKSSPLYLARLHDVQSEGLERCFSLKWETETLHTPEQPALSMADVGQRSGELSLFPVKTRPFRQLVYERSHSTQLLRLLLHGGGLGLQANLRNIYVD